MKLFGIGGTNGSGKDTVANYLVKHHGFYFASATDMLRQELEKRGRPTDRVHKSKLSSEWRREGGMAVIVDKAYKQYESQGKQFNGLIIGSLRHPGEGDRIHELGGKLIWVDGDPRVRYERIIANAHLRGRSAEDDKTFEEFMADEHREMYPEGDETTLHGAAVKDKADIHIVNDANDLAAFYVLVEKSLDLPFS